MGYGTWVLGVWGFRRVRGMEDGTPVLGYGDMVLKVLVRGVKGMGDGARVLGV